MLRQLSDTQQFGSESFSISGAHPDSDRMLDALRHHWPEYMMEAAGLGIFMVSASLFTVMLEHPDSPVRHAIVNPFLRRILIGIAMVLRQSVLSNRLGESNRGHT